MNFFGRPALAKQFDDLVDIVKGGPDSIFRISEAQNMVGQIGAFIIYLGSFGIVIAILWSGITYLRAGADQQKAQEAKERFKWTIVGTAIILGIGVIIATIGMFLGGSLQGPPPPGAGG